jgi:hypothetical protein
MPDDSTVLPITFNCAAISRASVQASMTAPSPACGEPFVSDLFHKNKEGTKQSVTPHLLWVMGSSNRWPLGK